jgi:hypothetical protein
MTLMLLPEVMALPPHRPDAWDWGALRPLFLWSAEAI